MFYQFGDKPAIISLLLLDIRAISVSNFILIVSNYFSSQYDYSYLIIETHNDSLHYFWAFEPK